MVRLHIVPALGAIPLISLESEHIQGFYAKCLQSGRRDGFGGLSAQSVHHLHRPLFQALKYAVKHKMIARNVAEAADPPRPKFREMATLDAEDVNRLLEHVRDTRYYPIFFTAIYTGLRRSELCGLTWGSIDLLGATLSVTQTLHRMKDGRIVIKQPKSKHGRRNIALPPALAVLLREYKAKQAEAKKALGLQLQDSDLVFSYADGRLLQPDSITYAFRKFAKSLGLPTLRFHDLRHTHATLLLKQGVHAKIVSERLGHSNIGITLDTYSHSAARDARGGCKAVWGAVAAGKSR